MVSSQPIWASIPLGVLPAHNPENSSDHGDHGIVEARAGAIAVRWCRGDMNCAGNAFRRQNSGR